MYPGQMIPPIRRKQRKGGCGEFEGGEGAGL
jgi:hypothetical protein